MQQSPAGIGQGPSQSLLAILDAVRPLGPITLIGQSHVECMRNALAPAADQIHVVNLWQFSHPPSENELPAIEGFCEFYGGIVVSALVGAGYDALTLFHHPRPFDFVSPYEPEAPFDADAEVIPFDAIRTAILAKAAHNFSLIERLRDLVQGRLLQVQPPPVWGHEPDVDHWSLDMFEPTDRFGSRYLRRKAYRVYSEIVAGYCAERGIELVSAPPESVDEQGFLRREYSRDPWHGNEAYGALMAERVLRRIAALEGIDAF